MKYVIAAACMFASFATSTAVLADPATDAAVRKQIADQTLQHQKAAQKAAEDADKYIRQSMVNPNQGLAQYGIQQVKGAIAMQQQLQNRNQNNIANLQKVNAALQKAQNAVGTPTTSGQQ